VDVTPLAKYRALLALFVASSFPIAIVSLYVHEAFVALFADGCVRSRHIP
jgi:hypothetical protein